jgi:hypothetical protein
MSLLLLLALRPEYREDTSTEVRIAEHTPVLWVQLPQHTLHILQQQPFGTEREVERIGETEI